MSMWAEPLESRTLMAAQGASVLWDDRQILIADQHAIDFDKKQIRVAAAEERSAALVLTYADHTRIRVDLRQLARDRRNNPGEVTQDLMNLEAAEKQLSADFTTSKNAASAAQTKLAAQLTAAGTQHKCDYFQLLSDRGVHLSKKALKFLAMCEMSESGS